MDMSNAIVCGGIASDLVRCFFIALTLTPLLASLKRAILGDNRLLLLRIA